MRILTRYLCREVLYATLVVLLALTALFAFFDLIHELGDLGKGNYRLAVIFFVVGLQASGTVYDLMPVAALIGALYGLAQLAAQSELTVMRSSGLSLGAIGRALMPVGVLFVALTLIFGEVVVPAAARRAQELKVLATQSLIAQEFRSGVWVKDERSFVNVREVHLDRGEARLNDVRIYEFDQAERLKTISLAKQGIYAGENEWTLRDVVQTHFSDTGTKLQRLPEAVWHSVLKPEILSVLLVVPEQMSVWSLYTYIRHLRDNAQRTTRYEIAIWTKLIYPLATLVMLLLAVPFSARQQRSGGVGSRLFLGILLGLGFHSANRLFSSIGQLEGLGPLLSAGLPTLLFFALALAFIFWTDRRTSGTPIWQLLRPGAKMS